MSSRDHARQMTDDELIVALQTVGGPLVVELSRRGFDVRLDNRNAASGMPVFVRVPRPRVVSE